ncbi:MAG TPA: plastocyanin/azurin family copper-binding protein [Solirubrobacterales bacterium]
MKKVAALLALALAAFALVACGDDDDSDTTTASDNGAATTTESGGGEKAGGSGGASGGAAAVEFESDPGGNLAYTTTQASTKAGNVTVEFNNPQAVPHDVAIEESSGKTIGQTEIVTEGSDSTTVELKPGKYTFYCSVPGHREAGMEGTLTAE